MNGRVIATIAIAASCVVGPHGQQPAPKGMARVTPSAPAAPAGAYVPDVPPLGRMPVEMVRASLTCPPLARGYRAQWKFYGEPLSPKAAVRRGGGRER